MEGNGHGFMTEKKIKTDAELAEELKEEDKARSKAEDEAKTSGETKTEGENKVSCETETEGKNKAAGSSGAGSSAKTEDSEKEFKPQQTEGGNSARTKTKKKGDRRQTFRVIAIIAVSIMIYLLTASKIMEQRGALSVNQYSSLMNETVQTADYAVGVLKAIDEAYLKFDANECSFFTNVSILLTKMESSAHPESDEKEILTELQEEIGDVTIYYRENGGTLEYVDRTDTPTLTDELLLKLEQDGSYRDGDQLYTSSSTDRGWVVMQWDPLNSLNIEEPLWAAEDDNQLLLLVSTEDGTIMQASEDDWIGLKWDEFFDGSVKEAATGVSYGTVKTTGLITYFTEKELTDQIFIVVMVSGNVILYDILRGSVLQLILLFICFFMLTRYALFMLLSKTQEGRRVYGKRLFGHIYLNISRLSQVSGLFILTTAISMVLVMYVQMLSVYSTQNVQANASLKLASNAVEIEEKNRVSVEEYIKQTYTDTVEFIAYAINRQPELAEEDSLRLLNSLVGGISLTLYNDVGTSVSSSEGYTDYPLTYDSANPEYQCRSLLEGSNISVVSGLDDDDNMCYAAHRRLDQTGLVVLQCPTDQYEDLMSTLSVHEYLKICPFGIAETFFILKEDPDTVWHINAETRTDEGLAIVLDDPLLRGDYSGLGEINGNNYYICEKMIGDTLCISAILRKDIWKIGITGLPNGLLGRFVLFIFLILSTMIASDLHHRVTITDDQPSDRSVYGIVMTESFRKTINRFMVVVIALLVCLALFERYVFSNSILRFLTADTWEHGFNLFSVTTILTAAIATHLGSVVVRKVILLIADNLGPKGATIGRMICSLISFGTLIFVIGFSAVQFGANLTYLLTGAGLAGVVIGWAGQGLINDLLNGLFIVFEGNFHVGDWITVGDWRGEVKEISVRTTRVAFGGDVKVFNNSQLSNVTVCCPNMCGALIYVSVAYEEQLDHVLELLKEYEAEFRREIPHIRSGPLVHGITKLGDSGVEVRIQAGVDNEKYAAFVERELRRVIKRLFDEHGIVIPFPQITLHDGKDRIINQQPADEREEGRA